MACTNLAIPGTFIIFEILVHVLILFSFLTFFYKFKVSQIETNAVSCELRNMTYAQTTDMLQKADTRSQQDMFKEILAGKLKTKNVFSSEDELKTWLKAQGIPQVYVDKLKGGMAITQGDKDTDIVAGQLVAALGLSNDPHGIQTTLAMSGEALDGLYRLYSKEDETTKTYNDGLFNQAFIVVALLLIMSIIYAFLIRQSCMICPTEFDIGHVLATNFWTFLIVGAVEVVFFLKVGLHWKPAPPSYMTASFTKSMQKYMGSGTMTDEEEAEQEEQECKTKPCKDVWPCAGEKDLNFATWIVLWGVVGAIVIVLFMSWFSLKYKNEVNELQSLANEIL